MRIVFLTELSHIGGVDTFLMNLADNWPRSEDELLVLANPGCPGLESMRRSLGARARVESHGVPVYGDIARSLGLGRFQRGLLSLFLRPFLAVSGYFRLRRLFFRLNPDRVMIVAGGFPGGDSIRLAVFAWASVRRGRPLAVLNLHNLVASRPAWNLMGHWFDRCVARRCAVIAGVSSASLAFADGRPGLAGACMIRRIHNGLADPARADGDDVRSSFGLPEDRHLIVMLSTYEERKGHAFLLHAFRKVLDKGVDALLVMCGHGSPGEIRRVTALGDSLGLHGRIVLSGYRADAKRLFEVADVIAIPSQAFESLPYAAIEGLAFGVPVVATSVGGLPEIIADGEGGWCVSPDDLDGFADRLYRLLVDGELRYELGRSGRSRYERLFTADAMAREYSALLA